MIATISTQAGPSQVAPRAGLALALLLGINLFNYIDRQVLSAVLPRLELDADLFRPDDPNLKSKLGWLTTAFLVSYMLLSPVFGKLAERRSCWVLVGIGVILWSLASGGSGLAVGYLALLLTRCLVGVGEAAYGPVAPAMLSDLYPERKRGRIMAWFYLAIPVGSALGFVIGGQVADTSLGWRGAFQVVVIPGLVLGALCFFMRAPRQTNQELRGKPASWRVVLRELKGVRSFVFCCAGMTCTTFVLGGVAAWAPYYIFEREARFEITSPALDKMAELRSTDSTPVLPSEVMQKLRLLVSAESLSTEELKAALTRSELTQDERKQYQQRIFEGVTAKGSISLGRVGLIFGGIVVISGLVSTLLGGWLGDALKTRLRGSYFKVCGYGAFIAFPPFVAMLFVPFPYAWGCVFLAVFFLFINTGPANTILANVSRHNIRARAFAVNIFIIHALGDAISPPLIGWVGDRASLGLAFLLCSVLIMAAGTLWLCGARYLDEETERITESERTLHPTGA
ncbi:MAG: MFS transporter [Gemmataceae bacterium]|nr:MFS transporter [Gemmataceae bacterium]